MKFDVNMLRPVVMHRILDKRNCGLIVQNQFWSMRISPQHIGQESRQPHSLACCCSSNVLCFARRQSHHHSLLGGLPGDWASTGEEDLSRGAPVIVSVAC